MVLLVLVLMLVAMLLMGTSGLRSGRRSRSLASVDSRGDIDGLDDGVNLSDGDHVALLRRLGSRNSQEAGNRENADGTHFECWMS